MLPLQEVTEVCQAWHLPQAQKHPPTTSHSPSLHHFSHKIPRLFPLRNILLPEQEKCHDPDFALLALGFAVDPFNCTPNNPLPRICSYSYAIRALVTGLGKGKLAVRVSIQAFIHFRRGL